MIWYMIMIWLILYDMVYDNDMIDIIQYDWYYMMWYMIMIWLILYDMIYDNDMTDIIWCDIW
jgi:hypothetical protein